MKTTLERGHHKFVGGDPALEGVIIIKDADRVKICLRNSRLNQWLHKKPGVILC